MCEIRERCGVLNCIAKLVAAPLSSIHAINARNKLNLQKEVVSFHQFNTRLTNENESVKRMLTNIRK